MNRDSHTMPLAVLLLFAAVIACSSGGSGNQTNTKLIQIDKSKEMQKGREDLIKDLTRKGLFAKIEDPGRPHLFVKLWVRPAWHVIDFDKKQSFASVVYAYYFDGTSYADTVIIVDAMNGKEIGEYSFRTPGLKLND